MKLNRETTNDWEWLRWKKEFQQEFPSGENVTKNDIQRVVDWVMILCCIILVVTIF